MAKVETLSKNNEKFKEKLNEFTENQEELMERKKLVALERVKVAETTDTPEEFKEVISELYRREEDLVKEGEALAREKGETLMNDITNNLETARKQHEAVDKFSDSKFDFIKNKVESVSENLDDIESESNDMLSELYKQIKKATHKWGGEND